MRGSQVQKRALGHPSRVSDTAPSVLSGSGQARGWWSLSHFFAHEFSRMSASQELFFRLDVDQDFGNFVYLFADLSATACAIRCPWRTVRSPRTTTCRST